MDKSVLCFLSLLVIVILVFYLNNQQKQTEKFTSEINEDLKKLDDVDLLNNIRYYNDQTYNKVKKNIILFYQIVDYIKTDITLFSRYFNNLLTIQTYIYYLIDSLHLNVVQHKDVKKSINELNKKIKEFLDLEIYKLLVQYKKHINNENEINIFTKTITDPKVRPYNML